MKNTIRCMGIYKQCTEQIGQICSFLQGLFSKFLWMFSYNFINRIMIFKYSIYANRLLIWEVERSDDSHQTSDTNIFLILDFKLKIPRIFVSFPAILYRIQNESDIIIYSRNFLLVYFSAFRNLLKWTYILDMAKNM